MRPEPFQNGDWLDLREIFIFSKSGMKSGNDDVYVSPIRERLQRQVEPALAARADPSYDASLETFYSYRPFDRRWFFNDPLLLNRPGPVMQRAWGDANVGLYALPSGTGAGPGVWCHGMLPDYRAFRGSYGGYAFPLYDRRLNLGTSNISPALIESLSVAYGEVVTPESVFDATLCLLSATSYTLRFAEDLEDVFPHVPFPARYECFLHAARVGADIRTVETFTRRPREVFRRADFARVATQPRGEIAAVEYVDGSISLCADGTGKITGLPQAVWDFAVSGYRVLPRWLEARIGLPADLALVREMREICGLIAELIDLFAEADNVLEATLQETLTREALGLNPLELDAHDG
jgi:Type ISP C-terminal specificity domain